MHLYNTHTTIWFAALCALFLAAIPARSQSSLSAQQQRIIFSDLELFWNAYDIIAGVQDTAEQRRLVETLFIQRGSAGLHNLIQAKNYTADDYVHAIRSYPKFWESLRRCTRNPERFTAVIQRNIQQFTAAYPALQHVPIYFTVGAFRSNGTILNNSVLIGCELALADDSVYTDELPKHLQEYMKSYQNPAAGIGLLCTHEYVHTQQRTVVDNLLSYCLYEGVAEFVSCTVTGQASSIPSFAFAQQNADKVRAAFERDLYIPSTTYNWLWGTNRNELRERDLGYYIGYTLCERFYTMAASKQEAIRHMIELDYTNEEQIRSFVDTTAWFSVPLDSLYNRFERSRPFVVSIDEFDNGSRTVSPTVKRITLRFSTPMSTQNTGFDFGPLGEPVALRVKRSLGFSPDATSFSFEVELQPNQRYQVVVTNNFQTATGIPLKPFLIDIQTAQE